MSSQSVLKTCQSAPLHCYRLLQMIWGAQGSKSSVHYCLAVVPGPEHYGKENMIQQACSLYGDQETEIERGKGRARYKIVPSKTVDHGLLPPTEEQNPITQ